MEHAREKDKHRVIFVMVNNGCNAPYAIPQASSTVWRVEVADKHKILTASLFFVRHAKGGGEIYVPNVMGKNLYPASLVKRAELYNAEPVMDRAHHQKFQPSPPLP